MPIAIARRFIAQAKIEETKHYFKSWNADDIAALLADPNHSAISNDLAEIAREVQTLASALKPVEEPTSLWEAQRELAHEALREWQQQIV